MQKLWQLLRKHFLLVLVLIYFVFVPLYPKLPLLDVVGTWVDVRLEDFFVAVMFAVLGISTLKKLYRLKSPLTLPIVLYWIAGFLSLIISLIFIGPSLPGFVPKVAIFHYLRRIEYMGMFFVTYFVFRNHKDKLPILALILSLTALVICIYGVGQKYQGWPAFSTMNEEFAKGVPLRLPPTARVMSTFAGHYDLAAYLVMVIPIFGSLIFSFKRKFIKLLLFLITLFCFLILLFTASRISFGVYLLTISIMLWWQKKKWLILPVIIGSIFALNFVSGASERFLKTFRFNDVVVDLSTGKPIGTLERVEGGKAYLERIKEPDEESLPKGSSFINVPNQATSSGTIGSVEIITKKELSGGKADVATVSGSFLVQKAFVLDISITTRFQGQWPRAWEYFQKNIITGAGYSVLNLAADGNYHRMLAETGILGTVAFLGIFLYVFVWFLKTREKLSKMERAFVIGVFSGIVGLLANAVLIDVFEASKVAFTLWMLLGVVTAILTSHPIKITYFSLLKKFFTHKITLITYLVLGIFILFSSSINNYFIGDDFTWLKWASQSNFYDLSRYFTDAQGFFYRPVPKLWYYLLFSIFWLMPQAYHLSSILLFIGITLGMLYLLRSLNIRNWIIGLSLALFATFSIHHENVFWISGQSSLLSGFFLVWSLVSLMMSIKRNKLTNILLYVLSWILLFTSMLSWDTLFLAPIIYTGFGVFLYKKKITWFNLILIPVYLIMRNVANAVPPAGDYGVNSAKILVNGVSNFITYILAIISGPRIIESSMYLRLLFRSNMVILSLIAGASVLISGILMVIFRNYLFKYKLITLSVFAFCLSLLPYLGLGGVSERYALIPSIFMVLLIAQILELIYKHNQKIIIKVIPLIILVVVIMWNFIELKRLSNDWKFASGVTEQTLVAIRKQFFPPKDLKTFVFIDTPIRYGRAWIFPIGLDDALWHMYRQTPFYFVQVKTVEDAFAYPNLIGTNKEILQFENFKLKQLYKVNQ